MFSPSSTPSKQSSLSPNKTSPKTSASIPTITPNSFYGAHIPSTTSSAPSARSSRPRTPPPLPDRPKKAGSAHTTYIPASTPPADASDWREPELIEDTSPPPSSTLVRVDATSWDKPAYPGGGAPAPATDAWGSATDYTAQDAIAWAAHASADGADSGWGNLEVLGAPGAASRVKIEGRNEREEEHWWDADARAVARRPGAGALPPLLADVLVDALGTLYKPGLEPPEAAPGAGPSAEAMAMATTHPRAYYAPAVHGWVVLQTLTTDKLKLTEEDAKRLPAAHRRAASSCVDSPGPGGNLTHHFHRVERLLPPSSLDPPLHLPVWKTSSGGRSPKRRRTSPTADGPSKDTTPERSTEDGGEIPRLDVWACCQCPVNVVVSAVLPTELPRDVVEEFEKDKVENPAAGKHGEETLMGVWETLVLILQKRLWKGETRSLPLSGQSSGFARRVGWNDTVKRITETLGFTVAPLEGGDPALKPRVMDYNEPGGREEEARQLRMWVEVSAWTAEYARKNKRKLEPRAFKLYVTLESQTEDIQQMIGAHVSQIPRGEGPDAMLSPELRRPIKDLGLTPPCASYEQLAFAYLAQTRCDPAHTPDHFASFADVVTSLYAHAEIPPESVQTLLMDERGRGRFEPARVGEAAQVLGFGEDGPLRVEYDPEEADDGFLTSAWRDALKRSWHVGDPAGKERRRDVGEAFRILGMARGSREMVECWERAERNPGVPPERAWQMLGIANDVDEGTVIAAFSMQVQDQPSQVDRLREAMVTIAEVTDSVRLKLFLETGIDPGDVVEPTRADLPRGLNQLGNTCYLNSLLQYFYTIKDLREAVTTLARAEGKEREESKLTEDDLKKHRVGGRLVTKREILRSKKFVSLLADLFYQMETAETAAVTPALDLAKLALVTSQDEDEESGSGGSRTDGSNDTDATLVDDPSALPSRPPAQQSPTPLSPGSVLGKRARARELKEVPMEVDEPADYVMVSKPSSPTNGAPAVAMAPVAAGPSSAGPSRVQPGAKDADGDVEMRPPETPKPVVKRKATAPAAGDSVMMFGRQHDVSECMDNCMFQIETALLRFGEMVGADVEKTSVVKSLFHGQLRQRITAVGSPSRTSRSSIHEKQDPFSHLPLNVSDEGYDLYDGLSVYFDDTVEFEGKPARMEVALVDLPPVLQIQLQRVQFDRETMTPYKSQAYVKFGDTICMDRFLDMVDPGKKARAKGIQLELNAARERIQALTKGKHAPYGPALTNAIKYLEHLGRIDLSKPDQGALDVLAGEEKIVEDELRALRTRAASLKTQLEDVWRDSADAVYELTSVFVHRGSSPSWGHYFFYSRHLPENPDAWFKYNDSEVTEVPKEEVFADSTGSTANPYLLVYARKGAEIVDTVKRFDPSRLVDETVA